MAELRALIPAWFSPLRARWHYYSMARKNFRGYLQGETVRLKKYFYVLRPLLAARWVEAGKGVPPMRFAELLAGSELCAPLRAEIDALLENELVRGEVPPVLPDSREGNLKDLDSLLMRTVMKS